jgi:FkbM family methyltransferase
MKKLIKKMIRKIISSMLLILGRFNIGQFIYEQFIDVIINRTKLVEHSGTKLVLSTPNGLTRDRADSFSSKEPETLDWLDGIPKNSVLWDIGANVGLYTCYVAKKSNCRVFAFEPSVFNLEVLARNIHLNGLSDLVTIIPLPLSSELSINKLNMTSTNWGGAMSTFGETYGHDGNFLDKVFVLPVVGLSMNDASNLLGIPQPDYIKMDVDGIEHLILKGGKPILDKAKGIIIEINDGFKIQSEDASTYLHDAGFELKEKLHAATYDSAESAARYSYNQIWVK